MQLASQTYHGSYTTGFQHPDNGCPIRVEWDDGVLTAAAFYREYDPGPGATDAERAHHLEWVAEAEVFVAELSRERFPLSLAEANDLLRRHGVHSSDLFFPGGDTDLEATA